LLKGKDLLLTLLFFAERVDGRTQIQKLAFLTQKETKLGESYHFVPWKFGPFSKDVWKDLDRLVSEGTVIEIPQGGKDKTVGYMYALTKDGARLVSDSILSRLDEGMLEQIKTIIENYSQKSLSELLTYVYERYPEYTEKSEWSGKHG
jgi:uncharacterized protein YwgA